MTVQDAKRRIVRLDRRRRMISEHQNPNFSSHADEIEGALIRFILRRTRPNSRMRCWAVERMGEMVG